MGLALLNFSNTVPHAQDLEYMLTSEGYEAWQQNNLTKNPRTSRRANIAFWGLEL